MNKKQIDEDISIQSGVIRGSSVGWLIKMLSSQMDSAMKEALEVLGVTPHQFMVVMTLMEVEGVSQSEIGRRVELPSYAVTRLLDSMEEVGLLQRHPDENSRRSFSIRLTEKGKALGPQLFKVVKDVNKRVLKPLSAEERRQLTALLAKMAPDWNGGVNS